jgi:hypothetical protein
MSSNLVQLKGVNAPTPKMHREAAEVFDRLRTQVRDAVGFDFLAKCGDIFRPANFKTSKDGVADQSWHKTGRAFDYDQTSSALVIVSEPRGGKQYFRTYLRCAKQDGTMGIRRAVRDYRGYNVSAWLFDFTLAAETVGFKRIPAWSGWERNYNRREFWHYQYNPQNLSWDAAMKQISGATAKPSTPSAATPTTASGPRLLKQGDRGDDVRQVQVQLVNRDLLAGKDADSIYGPKTVAAVKKFQANNKLTADGIVGPATRARLFGK